MIEPSETPSRRLPPLERRAHDVASLTAETWDVVIVGGGIVGTGAVLDAVSRGLRAVLVEQDDIAAGTSSRSSRLIHGGLRYLEQFRFGLVREALAVFDRRPEAITQLVERGAIECASAAGVLSQRASMFDCIFTGSMEWASYLAVAALQ